MLVENVEIVEYVEEARRKMKFNYENLKVSQLSLDLINLIYNIIKKFPKNEEFVITAQLKRSVSSILLNIAEGSGKYSKQDFARYIRNSIGSLLEVDATLKIALNQNYITAEELMPVRAKIEELYYKLIAFEKSLIGRRQKG